MFLILLFEVFKQVDFVVDSRGNRVQLRKTPANILINLCLKMFVICWIFASYLNGLCSQYDLIPQIILEFFCVKRNM